jgi:uncharacterized membrane protein YhaH (DUF805 family)
MEKSIFGWYGYTFSKYATFAGRARRTEYWYFALLNTIATIALAIAFGDESAISLIFSLVLILPSIAVGARRLHDIGRSGWWQLIWLVPIIGWIVLIVFFATNGQSGDNQYGPDPKVAPMPELSPNA